jgi:osmotically-inducible protein OsmY
MTTGAQATSAPGVFQFANNPAAFLGAVGADPTGGVTAPVLMAAVAMRRGQPQGPTNDQEVEDFIYDAFELLPGTADVEVRCDGGRATLTGSVHHKRLKRDVGEIAWAIPALHDVQNNVTIASRRRARSASRDTEVSPANQGRKQS